MYSAEQYVNIRNRDWALYPIRLAGWLRENPIKRPRVNTKKFILGLVLSNISGDDSNCFNSVIQHFRAPDSDQLHEVLQDGRLNILDRLEWEMTEPAVPMRIRRRLMSVHGAIEQKPWEDRGSFDEALEAWVLAQKYVSERVNEDVKLRLAVEHYTDLSTYVGQAYAQAITASNT